MNNVKKLNNKGVTLIELIVSFMLVAVAIIYFYQTLYTVKKLYTESQKETNEFVKFNYAFRIADAYIRQKGFDADEIMKLIKETDEYDKKNNNIIQDISNSNCYIITIDGKSQELWIYNQSSSNEES